MLRVYIAGPIQGTSCIHTLENIAAFTQAHNTLLKIPGIAPYNPAADTGAIGLGGLSLRAVQNASLSFMEICDCVALLPGWEHSKGTQNEIKISGEKGIPILRLAEFVALVEGCSDNRKRKDLLEKTLPID